MLGRLWPPALVSLLFFYKLTDHSISAVWQEKWQLLFACFFLVAAFKSYQKLQNVTFILSVSALLTNLLLLGNREPLIQLYVYSYATYLFAAFFCLYNLSLKELSRILEALSYAGLLLSLCVWIQFLCGHDTKISVLIFGNPAMAASFIAMTIAFFPLPAQIFMLLAIVLTGGFTAMLAGVISVLISSKRERFVLCAIGPLIVVTLGYFQTVKLATGNGRYPLWAESFSWWFHMPFSLWLTGTGPGTFGVVSRAISQEVNPGTTVYYPWLHSDWLQILFEQGLLGITGALVLFVQAIARATKSDHLLAAITAYGVLMLTQFPWHWPIHALLGMVVFAIVFKRDA